MESTIQHIDRLLQTLAELQPLQPENQARLDKKMRLEFNYNSNHIEGNPLTYGETELLLIFDKTTGNHELREYEEMKAHDVAFELIKEWATDRERPLSEMALKYLHEILLVRPFWKEAVTPEGHSTRRLIKVGNYKEQPNSVRLQSGDLFHYASPEETPMLMGDLVQWYRDEEDKGELHPVALAAWLHYKFVRIHPFDDGNGRLSRLLMNYSLFRHSLPPVIIPSADKKNYLFALNQADAGDMNAFIAYIAKQAVRSLELAIKAAKGESLDEPDDLQKEIAVWKRGAVKKREYGLHRNDDLVYELYHNGGVKELLEDFAQEHRQFFDLFRESYTNVSVQKLDVDGIRWIPIEIDKNSVKIKPDFHEREEMQKEDNYKCFHVEANLKEYKYNEDKPFSIHSLLRIHLLASVYEVHYGLKFFIAKSYTLLLTIEERNQIVVDCIKDVFSQIKTESIK